MKRPVLDFFERINKNRQPAVESNVEVFNGYLEIDSFDDPKCEDCQYLNEDLFSSNCCQCLSSNYRVAFTPKSDCK